MKPSNNSFPDRQVSSTCPLGSCAPILARSPQRCMDHQRCFNKSIHSILVRSPIKMRNSQSGHRAWRLDPSAPSTFSSLNFPHTPLRSRPSSHFSPCRSPTNRHSFTPLLDNHARPSPPRLPRHFDGRRCPARGACSPQQPAALRPGSHFRPL